jgi:hypothetical protein
MSGCVSAECHLCYYEHEVYYPIEIIFCVFSIGLTYISYHHALCFILKKLNILYNIYGVDVGCSAVFIYDIL